MKGEGPCARNRACGRPANFPMIYTEDLGRHGQGLSQFFSFFPSASRANSHYF